MPHIHTQDGQHDLTASALIVRLDGDEPRLLLHFHKKLKLYIQFGGHVELNETPWHAIIHELKEETGYTIEQLKILQPKSAIKHVTGSVIHPLPMALITHTYGELDHYHTDTLFGFTTTAEPQHAVEEGESADIKLFTAKQLAEAPEDLVPKGMKELGNLLFEQLLAEWEEIDPHLFQ